LYFVGTLHVSESRELEKLVFCLTGPYLTRRATIGWLELPFVGRARGRFVGPPTSGPQRTKVSKVRNEKRQTGVGKPAEAL
jgi:hypothetical protein